MWVAPQGRVGLVANSWGQAWGFPPWNSGLVSEAAQNVETVKSKWLSLNIDSGVSILSALTAAQHLRLHCGGELHQERLGDEASLPRSLVCLSTRSQWLVFVKVGLLSVIDGARPSACSGSSGSPWTSPCDARDDKEHHEPPCDLIKLLNLND